MIRKSVDDISDEEVEKILIPFANNTNEFMNEYVIPEVVAFYIANAFYRNAMWESSMIRIYNSASDMINVTSKDKNKSVNEIKKSLRIKYALNVVNDDPLELERIEY